MDEFEELRMRDPAAYRRLMDSLPDVRDGLNRQQRNLLVTMKRLGLASDARMKRAGSCRSRKNITRPISGFFEMRK